MSNENHPVRKFERCFPLGEYVPESVALERLCEAFESDKDWARMLLRTMGGPILEKAYNSTIVEFEYRRRPRQEQQERLEDERRGNPGPGLCAKISHGMPLTDEEQEIVDRIEREVAEETGEEGTNDHT